MCCAVLARACRGHACDGWAASIDLARADGGAARKIFLVSLLEYWEAVQVQLPVGAAPGKPAPARKPPDPSGRPKTQAGSYGTAPRDDDLPKDRAHGESDTADTPRDNTTYLQRDAEASQIETLPSARAFKSGLGAGKGSLYNSHCKSTSHAAARVWECDRNRTVDAVLRAGEGPLCAAMMTTCRRSVRAPVVVLASPCSSSRSHNGPNSSVFILLTLCHCARVCCRFGEPALLLTPWSLCVHCVRMYLLNW